MKSNYKGVIPFNIPAIAGNEERYIKTVLTNKKLSGDGEFINKCTAWFEKRLGCKKALLLPSCTHALEMAAILADIKEGDEVIMPSYTFASTANAFILRGAKIIFLDIRPDTMNIDENLIEKAVSDKTKAIVPSHYAGVSCEMDEIKNIASRYNLLVVEDAAQGMMSTYKEKPLGTIGEIGCYSFHETKNYTCGEGGLIILNDERFIERAEIIREKGTNRNKFIKGLVDKYTWVDIGSSYIPNELTAAFLYAQLELADEINEDRSRSWNIYYNGLKDLADRGIIELPFLPYDCKQNGHIFYIKVKDFEERVSLMNYLKKKGISSAFHYIPLHSSEAGKVFCRFSGKDKWTTRESERLLRLPMYYKLSENDINTIIDTVDSFYRNS